MAVVQEFDLNLIPDSEAVVVKVNQYDTGEGRLVAHLYVDELSYSPASGATAKIEGTKPDSKGFSYSATISGNKVTADLTEQMTAVAGRTRAQIVVTETTGKTGTFVFWLEVQKAALGEDTDISETEIPAIIDVAERNAKRAEDAADSAGQSATAAAESANAASESAESAAESASEAITSATNAENSASEAAGSAEAAATSASNAATSASNAASSANDSSDYANKAKSWAVGPNGTGESGTDTNNAAYWASMAQQYAQGGMIYKGSILYANIPTSGMRNGDMYDIKEAFVTDSRFIEGSGISCVAGTDIIWVEASNKWNILTPTGIMIGATASKNGAAGIVPAPSAGAQEKFLRGDGSWQEAGSNITVDSALSSTSENPVQNKVINTALGNKRTTGSFDDTNDTVTYTSNDAADDSSATSWLMVAKLTSGETLKSLFSKISSLANNVRYLYSKKRTTDAYDDKNDTVTFTTADVSSDSSATSWTTVSQLTSGSTFATLLNRISAMMKNTRYLYNALINKTSNYREIATISCDNSEITTSGYLKRGTITFPNYKYNDTYLIIVKAGINSVNGSISDWTIGLTVILANNDAMNSGQKTLGFLDPDLANPQMQQTFCYLLQATNPTINIGYSATVPTGGKIYLSGMSGFVRKII